jgi:hypothetical protein
LVEPLQAEDVLRRALVGGGSEEIPVTKRISANRRNCKESTGPKNTTSTRFNATKHVLLADGITELDNAEEYRNTLRRLNQAYLAELETFLLERMALNMVRLRRCARLEAECLTGILNPPIYGETQEVFELPSFKSSLIDRGLPARITSEKFEPIVSTFQRYETSVENKLFRQMHEVERLRRLIQGEKLPPPVAVDVAVHTDNAGLDSFAESADPEAIEGSLSEPPHKREEPSPGVDSKEVEGAISVELNDDTDAGGLVAFVEPPKVELLEGPGVEHPDEENQAIVAPEGVTETPKDEDE